jgi:hypothetical protein
MNQRIRNLTNRDEEHRDQPRPIGQILAELLAQYQVRFPQVRIAVLETPADRF